MLELLALLPVLQQPNSPEASLLVEGASSAGLSGALNATWFAASPLELEVGGLAGDAWFVAGGLPLDPGLPLPGVGLLHLATQVTVASGAFGPGQTSFPLALDLDGVPTGLSIGLQALTVGGQITLSAATVGAVGLPELIALAEGDWCAEQSRLVGLSTTGSDAVFLQSTTLPCQPDPTALAYGFPDPKDLRLSPDGSHVSYVLDWAILASTPERLFVTAIDGSSVHVKISPLTEPMHKVTGHCWSPDGEWLAYGLDDNTTQGTNRLFLARRDGSDLTEIFPPLVGTEWIYTNNDTDLAFSHDGRFLSVATFRSPGRERLLAYDRDTDGWAVLVDDPAGVGYDLGSARWSPTAPAISFLHRPNDPSKVELSVHDALAGTTTIVSGDNADDVRDAKWSPDGSRIAFSAERTENNSIRLFTVDPDGTDEVLVSQELGANQAAFGTFIEDGTQLHFWTRFPAPGPTRLFVAPADGSAAPTEVYAIPSGEQLWNSRTSPDDRHVLAQLELPDDGGPRRFAFRTVRLDGAGATTIGDEYSESSTLALIDWNEDRDDVWLRVSQNGAGGFDRSTLFTRANGSEAFLVEGVDGDEDWTPGTGFAPDGPRYLLRTGTSELRVIDPATGTITSPGPAGLGAPFGALWVR